MILIILGHPASQKDMFRRTLCPGMPDNVWNSGGVGRDPVVEVNTFKPLYRCQCLDCSVYDGLQLASASRVDQIMSL